MSILNRTSFRLTFEHLASRTRKNLATGCFMDLGRKLSVTESMGMNCSILNQTSFRLVLHVGTKTKKRT